MLETREERVKLIKAGISCKVIERLYIEGNNFKVIRFCPEIELLEVDIRMDGNCCLRIEAAGKCA